MVEEFEIGRGEAFAGKGELASVADAADDDAGRVAADEFGLDGAAVAVGPGARRGGGRERGKREREQRDEGSGAKSKTEAAHGLTGTRMKPASGAANL